MAGSITHSRSRSGPKSVDETIALYWRMRDMTSQNITGNGMNDQEIARILGIADKTVLRWRRANGVPNCWGKYPDATA